MASLDWTVTRTGGVTLVELLVTSDVDEQVRIESRLEPVWPPRRQGVPVAGWDGNTFEGSVDRDDDLAVGFATPAEPEEPPAEIVATGADLTAAAVTARDVVRSLGQATPPRDAVPGHPDCPDSRGAVSPTEGDTPADDSRPGTNPITEPTGTGAVGGHSEVRNGTDMESWFGAIEDRIGTAKRLSGATNVDEARDAVVDVGGLEEVRALKQQLDADREQLAGVEKRVAGLDDELGTVDVPLSTLERIA